ncbi:MAG: hypothetical protein CV089_03820 [Nitrospira sp. WS110]|nr:hypothetical protein [Nitrospira sp. WS110]
MKIGRNDPCPCGSGKKFKKCHIGPQFELPFLIQQARIAKQLEEEGKRLLEQHQAKEIQRQAQQGLGSLLFQRNLRGTDSLPWAAICIMASGKLSRIFWGTTSRRLWAKRGETKNLKSHLTNAIQFSNGITTSAHFSGYISRHQAMFFRDP